MHFTFNLNRESYNHNAIHTDIYEPPREKTNNLHWRKQRRSTFVFATRIVQFLFYLNPKFQASSSFLCLYSPVCVEPVRKPHCWFSHEAAHIYIYNFFLFSFTSLSSLLEMTVFLTVFPVGRVIDIDVDDDDGPTELTSAPPNVTRLRLTFD